MFETLQSIIRQTVSISWSDILDISIVAFVVYKAIKLVKETRAEQLIKGIVILLVTLQLSDWLQLNAINYILKNTMQFGLLALIIVFQPELRRALEHVGRSNLSNILKMEADVDVVAMRECIEDICLAISSLSYSRIGALIVIERNTKVGDVIRTGTILDATVTSQLLENVFFPNSPLHDGAVVIRGNRIFAANCYLPLTEDTSLSRELGTRHRAAIGVSEVSDSVVVIVSEETGKISIALNGDLTRNLTVESLSKALIRLLIPSDGTPKDGKSFIKKVKNKWQKDS